MCSRKQDDACPKRDAERAVLLHQEVGTLLEVMDSAQDIIRLTCSKRSMPPLALSTATTIIEEYIITGVRKKLRPGKHIDARASGTMHKNDCWRLRRNNDQPSSKMHTVGRIEMDLVNRQVAHNHAGNQSIEGVHELYKSIRAGKESPANKQQHEQIQADFASKRAGKCMLHQKFLFSRLWSCLFSIIPR